MDIEKGIAAGLMHCQAFVARGLGDKLVVSVQSLSRIMCASIEPDKHVLG